MLGDLFSGWHIWIILLIIVLLFGATRLPALARSIGQSTRIFKKEIRESQEEDEAAEAAKSAKTEAEIKSESAAADKPADKI
ncbi:Sec-independent protein translocase subunit TatA [Humibacter albus]|jgi:sec-independent protein translocase protein TatA|uniref:Sec-independent protein translocase subunit TatA n=1 Tax=Humibacter albus TaxID=427754 RepID=UPI0004046B2C|nr:Sec-independent protein translocase subunit TatA [Humibacter albus]